MLRHADGNLLTFLQDVPSPSRLLGTSNKVSGDPETEPSQHGNLNSLDTWSLCSLLRSRATFPSAWEPRLFGQRQEVKENKCPVSLQSPRSQCTWESPFSQRGGDSLKLSCSKSSFPSDGFTPVGSAAAEAASVSCNVDRELFSHLFL